MKKLTIIGLLAAGATIVISCGDVQRKPSATYMPDMAYSRAYETYMYRDSSKFTTNAAEAGGKIFYDNTPVSGTIARGEELPYHIPMDAGSDTTNYNASKLVVNPLPALDEKQLAEAERLYLINCGICHGTKLDGNGPLYNNGSGPYAAKPADLINSPANAGAMFYTITYGKNKMGSYASQLNRKQRWMVISYINSKRTKTAPPATAKADSTAAAKPAGAK